MVLKNLAGLPAQTSPSLTTELSSTTAPAATNPPFSTVACLTVAPIETKALFWMLAPCKMEFGPIKTWFPMLTFLEIWTRSWITQLSPMVIPWFPKRVAPYQIDDFSPALTLPIIVAFGATKSVYYNWGLRLSMERFLKLGTILSSDPNSPSSLFPATYNFFPKFLNNGPVSFSWTLTMISKMMFFISLSIIYDL